MRANKVNRLVRMTEGGIVVISASKVEDSCWGFGEEQY